jgi:dipeptidase E
MTKIVAIGGGTMRGRTAVPIHREIIRLSEKKRPKLLFIPTASSDHEGHCQQAYNYFGNLLGCKTDVLRLLKNPPAFAKIEQQILSSDIIYVGGGNTLMMMRLWRRLGVDNILRRAYRQGVVMSGVSAGAICWFDSGHSDSMSFYNPKKWKYVNVKGLGLLPGIFCPHFNSGTLGLPRRNEFKQMMRRTGGLGIAVEDRCAIAFIGGRYEVISANGRAKAYRVYKRHGEIVAELLSGAGEPQLVSNLYHRHS